MYRAKLQSIIDQLNSTSFVHVSEARIGDGLGAEGVAQLAKAKGLTLPPELAALWAEVGEVKIAWKLDREKAGDLAKDLPEGDIAGQVHFVPAADATDEPAGTLFFQGDPEPRRRFRSIDRQSANFATGMLIEGEKGAEKLNDKLYIWSPASLDPVPTTLRQYVDQLAVTRGLNGWQRALVGDQAVAQRNDAVARVLDGPSKPSVAPIGTSSASVAVSPSPSAAGGSPPPTPKKAEKLAPAKSGNGSRIAIFGCVGCLALVLLTTLAGGAFALVGGGLMASGMFVMLGADAPPEYIPPEVVMVEPPPVIPVPPVDPAAPAVPVAPVPADPAPNPDTKPTEAKPSDPKPADAKPKPPEPKPTNPRDDDVDLLADDPKPVEPKPADTKTVTPKPGGKQVTVEGNAKVVLVKGGQRFPLPAKLAAGKYDIEATFEGEDPVLLGKINISGEGGEVVSCNERMGICKPK